MPADLDRLRRQMMSLQEAEKAANELDAARRVVNATVEFLAALGSGPEFTYPPARADHLRLLIRQYTEIATTGEIQ